ncbi:MAG: hypothetical protein ACLSVD_12480 [Eggerthellaceae bacterium]
MLVWLVIELVMTVRTRKTVDDLQRQVSLRCKRSVSGAAEPVAAKVDPLVGVCR